MVKRNAVSPIVTVVLIFVLILAAATAILYESPDLLSNQRTATQTTTGDFYVSTANFGKCTQNYTHIYGYYYNPSPNCYRVSAFHSVKYHNTTSPILAKEKVIFPITYDSATNKTTVSISPSIPYCDFFDNYGCHESANVGSVSINGKSLYLQAEPNQIASVTYSITTTSTDYRWNNGTEIATFKINSTFNLIDFSIESRSLS